MSCRSGLKFYILSLQSKKSLRFGYFEYMFLDVLVFVSRV